MKIGSLMLLSLLTLTVAAYNYQFHSIPYSMYLNAGKLPSWETPLTYVNVTEDGHFRAGVIDYVIASDTANEPIRVPEQSVAEFWLKNASNSSRDYDITVRFFDDFYYLQVRYFPAFQRTYREYVALWALNIITVIAWIGTVISVILGKKTPPIKGG